MMTYDELQELADYFNTLLPPDHQIELFPWDPNHAKPCIEANECLLTHFIKFLTVEQMQNFEEPFGSWMDLICLKYDDIRN